MDFRMVLHEIASAIGPKRFLVGYGGERKLAAEPAFETIEIGIGEEGRRGAGLHVGDAAAIDLAVRDFPTPGVAGPAGAVVGDREHVDMTIEDKMAPGVRAVKAADDVGHLG